MLFYTRERAASLVAALSFTCSTFFASKVFAGHLPLMQTMTWLPWIMLCYEKSLEKAPLSRWALLAGCCWRSASWRGTPRLT